MAPMKVDAHKQVRSKWAFQDNHKVYRFLVSFLGGHITKSCHGCLNLEGSMITLDLKQSRPVDHDTYYVSPLRCVVSCGFPSILHLLWFPAKKWKLYPAATHPLLNQQGNTTHILKQTYKSNRNPELRETPIFMAQGGRWRLGASPI